MIHVETRKVNKTALGYKDIKHDFENFSHVIFDEEAYNDFLFKINLLENKVNSLNDDKTRLEDDFNLKVKEIEANTQSRIDAIIKENDIKIKDYKNALNKQLNLNENLIRISIERANAKRNLSPKKERLGYILISAEENVFKKKIRKELIDFKCWRYILETPYSIKIGLDEFQLLFIGDYHDKLRELMNLENFYKNYVVDSSSFEDEIWKNNGNFIFKHKFKLNTLKGFWEVEFFTRDLINISDEFLKQKTT